jgi:hypothetical protein
MNDRKEFHGPFNRRWKNGRYGENVREKAEKNGTIMGKSDERV